ncbi:hypothetical protein Tco_1376291 [Tanacetum coccineum]
MSSATSNVTYTSVYSDSEPGRAFWGTDYEEVSEGGIPRIGFPTEDSRGVRGRGVKGWIRLISCYGRGKMNRYDGDDDATTHLGTDTRDEDMDEDVEGMIRTVGGGGGALCSALNLSLGELLGDAPPAHSPPLHHHHGCSNPKPGTKDSIQPGFNDAVTAALTPHSLPPLPPISIHTIILLFIGESSTARPARGQGIDYRFVSTVDAEERRQGIRDVGYGIRDTWVDPAEAIPEITPMTVEEEMLWMDDRWMVEDGGYASREAWAHSIGLSQATNQELQTHCDHVRMSFSDTFERHDRSVWEDRMVENLRVIRDMRRRDEATKCGTNHGTYIRRKVPKLPLSTTPTQTNDPESIQAMIRPNSLRNATMGMEVTFVANETEKIDKYLSGLPDNIYGNVKAAKPKTLDEIIELASDLMDRKLLTYAERQSLGMLKRGDGNAPGNPDANVVTGLFSTDIRQERGGQGGRKR